MAGCRNRLGGEELLAGKLWLIAVIGGKGGVWRSTGLPVEGDANWELG
jgi:hypothetical protein